MDLQDIFADNKKKYDRLVTLRTNDEPEATRICPKCKNVLKEEKLKKHLYMCYYCAHHFAMPPRERIGMLGDLSEFREFQKDLTTLDPLEFPGYTEKVAAAEERSGEKEAVITGIMKIGGIKTAIGVMDGRFLMGSMGTVVGEKITALAENARKKKLPLLIFTASGGARMQEGLFSLMQMAKTSAAIQRFKEDGGLFITVLTDPTTGGVSASFASLGDIIIAEPDALICFAGPRVIEQTIGRSLPQGFQRAEFLEEHGMVDMVITRRKLKETLYKILTLHLPEKAGSRTKDPDDQENADG